jgi:glycosyltransferase involved in cell wall biosynthesis
VISVVTPTWRRFELLTRRCIPSVAAQTYPGGFEHVVVSDGPDEELRAVLADVPGVRYDELAEHSPVGQWGEFPRLAGIEVAKGDVIAYLDDDNAFRPRHLEVLAEALGSSGAGFAYGQMAVNFSSGSQAVIGGDTPAYCHIDTSMIVHRRELLDVATWRVGYPTIDWDLVERWMAAGVRWVHVPEVTVDYYSRV